MNLISTNVLGLSLFKVSGSNRLLQVALGCFFAISRAIDIGMTYFRSYWKHERKSPES